MAFKNFPYHLRRQCLRLFADGWHARKIMAHTGVKMVTFRKWAREVEVKSSSMISDEELEEKIARWKHLIVTEEREEERKGMSAARRSRFDAADRKKFGMTPAEKAKQAEKTARSWDELASAGADPDEWQDHIAGQFERTKLQLEQATSIPEQVNALQAGIMLVQLQEIMANPPPVTSWGDVEKVTKLLRQALGMDNKDSDMDENSLDVRVLNVPIVKSEKGRIIRIGGGRKKQ